jgi:hypothetical protein
MIYPVLYSLTLGFRNATVETFVGGEMNFNGLANYQSVIADRVFWKALTNTVLFTVLSLVNKSFGKGSSLRPVGSLLAVFCLSKIVSPSTFHPLSNRCMPLIFLTHAGVG